MKTLKQQKDILKKILAGKKVEKEAPKTAPQTFLIPKWQDVAPTYAEAVEWVLKQIAATRPFYNYREGQIIGHIKETSRKIEGMKSLKTDGAFYVLEAQTGEGYKGRSVEDVRKSFSKNEFGLGAFEVGCILLTHPELLEKYEDLWIDCPGDEYTGSDGRFDRAPIFDFGDGRVWFGARFVSYAYAGCGSASGFASQPLEN